jgi:hypothetical protein
LQAFSLTELRRSIGVEGLRANQIRGGAASKSAQLVAGAQGVAGQEFGGGHGASALQLQFFDAERAFATGDDDALFAGVEDDAGGSDL